MRVDLKAWWPNLGVAFAAIAVHAPALRAGYAWLDHAHVEHGLAWQSFASFADTGYFRPLVSLSLVVDHTLAAAFHAGPTLFHLTNLLLHAACALLVNALGEELGLGRWRSALAGLVFAVHPLNTLVASAIAFRSEALLLLALGSLVLAHLRGRALQAGLALFAACLTKETAWGLGPLFLLALAFPATLGLAGQRAARPVWLAEAAGLLGAGALRTLWAPAWRASHAELSLAEALATRLGLLTRSLRELFLFGDGSLSDATRVLGPTAPPALVGLLIFLGLALWTFARRGTSILACLALLPLLHLVPVTRWWSPHYLYVPLAFASLAVLELLREQVKTLAVVAAGALLFCAPKSWLGSARYRDDESLFTPELTAHPEFREAQFYVAELERQRGHFELARAGYVRALEPRPGVLAYVDQKAAFGNLATVELELGRPEVARRLFQRAKQLATRDEERRQLNYNEALAAFRTGAFVETARLLEDEVERPDALAWAIRLRRDALARSPSR